MARSASRSGDQADQRTRDKILRAALDWITETGVTKVSMDEIAHRARLARATLYLHFPGRQALIGAAVRAELNRFFADLATVVSGYDDIEQRLVEGFGYGFRALREHRTLNAVLELNPQILLPYVVGDAPAIARARRTVVEFIPVEALAEGVDAEVIAEQIVRSFHTLILAPSTVFDLDGPDGPERYARRFLVPLLRPEFHTAQQPDQTDVAPHSVVGPAGANS
ncbi:TetR/AcrR family transcriptional regulator [Nocardia sp. NPDC059180]|uniref:TetR/AcrR family transcriptional regulator n=1 Tax=Nocardia sp. NPDC059180 TaxID=3346761 RepID=UPI003683C2DE